MKKAIVILLIGILLSTGCISVTPSAVVVETQTPSRTPMSTRTPKPTKTPTVTPSRTSIPLPTITIESFPPLVSHDFKPNPILVTYNNDWDGFCESICPPDTVPFVLFGDGNLFVEREVEIDGYYGIHFLHKKLDRSETCRILNTIDQVGFFEFDPSTYSVPKVYDASNWRVEVYAWRTKDVTLYALGDLFNDFINIEPATAAQINPPSVLYTFNLLYNYPSSNLDIYIPNLIVVWVWKSSSPYLDIKDWTLNDISLKDLYEKGGSVSDALPHPIFLDGSDAKNIYEMFGNFNYYGDVMQAGERYSIYMRAVLPFEKIKGEVSILSPNATQMNLPSNLHCSPLDGAMPLLPIGKQ